MAGPLTGTRVVELAVRGAALALAVLLTGCTSTAEPANSAIPAQEPRTPSVPTASPTPSPVSGPSTYLALGDSVAAGVGATPPATGGYVPLLAGLLSERLGCAAPPAAGCPVRLRNLAESGATTATLLRRQLPEAVELLRIAPDDVRLVTVTIGGNDVFETVVRACAPAPQAPACRAAVVSSLAGVSSGVDEVLRAVTTAVPPGTPVAVMAYYDPLFACRLAPLRALGAQVLEGTDALPGLNDILRARAADYGALVVETRDRLTERNDFVGGKDCLHPSGSGHARIAQAFLEAVGARVASR